MTTALTHQQIHGLNQAQLDALEVAFNSLRDEILADLGEKDARYIKSIVRMQRGFEVAGRVALHFSLTPIGWALGTASLGIAKILDNMEIGHNVMHGQYDWMNDPKLNSQTFEWDTACDAQSWKRTHNYEHHTYTNILGKDRDYGYAVLRLSDDTPWHPAHTFQLGYYALLSLFFQWGVALHELETEKLRTGEISLKDKRSFLKEFFRKGGRQAFKDYVFFPLLAGPFALKVLAGNAAANVIRNLWASTIIFCGHFTEGAQTFPESVCDNESKGHWYYRQLLGSSNFTGGRWLHIMSGHLSYQIEHHLFPDLPAHRYAEMSPRVQAICEEFGLPYNTGSFWQQYKTVVKRIARYSLPTRKARQEVFAA